MISVFDSSRFYRVSIKSFSPSGSTKSLDAEVDDGISRHRRQWLLCQRLFMANRNLEYMLATSWEQTNKIAKFAFTVVWQRWREQNYNKYSDISKRTRKLGSDECNSTVCKTVRERKISATSERERERDMGTSGALARARATSSCARLSIRTAHFKVKIRIH